MHIRFAAALLILAVLPRTAAAEPPSPRVAINCETVDKERSEASRVWKECRSRG